MRVPTQAEIIIEAIQSRLLDVFGPMPATVLAYDPATQTIDARPVVQRQLPTDDEDTLAAEPLPDVTNVPVLFPRGGGYRVTWPINPGDTVLLVPLMLSITAWRQGMSKSDISDQGLHHIANCIAIPGLTPDVQAAAAEPLALVIEGPDVRLGAADASDFVALASLVKAELDAIATTLGSLTAGAQSFGTAYNPNDVAATLVKAK